MIFNDTFVSYFYWNRENKYPWNVLQSSNREIKYPRNLTTAKSTGWKLKFKDKSGNKTILRTFQSFKEILVSQAERKNFMKEIAVTLIKFLTRKIKIFNET